MQLPFAVLRWQCKHATERGVYLPMNNASMLFPPSSTADELSARASFNYNNGMYGLAHDSLLTLESEMVSSSRMSGAGTHPTLVSLAIAADISFCKAQAALSQTLRHRRFDKKVHKMLEESRNIHENYRRSLVRASKDVTALLAKPAGNECSERNYKHLVEYATCIIMCGVKEVWLYLKLGNMRGATASFFAAVRAAASCCMGCVSDTADENLMSMTLNEAISVIEKSSVMSIDPRSMEAIRFMSHTNRVLCQVSNTGCALDRSSTDEKVVHYHASNRKKARLQHHQRRLHDFDFSGTRSFTAEEIIVNAVTTYCSNTYDPVLFVHLENSLVADPHCHLARHLKVLLRGHVTCDKEHEHCIAFGKSMPSIFNDLKKLVPTCRAAAQLLGCMYAKRGKYLRALEIFQRALAMDEDSKDRHSRSHLDTVVNAALCFRYLGEPESAAKLLSYVLSQKEEPQSDVNEASTPISVRIRVLSEKNDISLAISDEYNCERGLHLSELYRCAGVISHWDSCIAATDEMLKLPVGPALFAKTSLANVYSLLQGGQPDVALARLVQWQTSTKHVDRFFSLASSVYESDCAMHLEKGINNSGNETVNDKNGKFEPSSMILTLFEQTMDILEGFLQDNVASKRCSYMNMKEIISVVKNNHGISLLMSGQSVDAMTAFQEATENSCFFNAGRENDSFLVPFFNISLLLWQQGNCKDACDVWVKARQFVTNEIHNDAGQIRCTYQEAVSRHGLLHAKLGNKNESARCGDCGLEKLQTAALDVLILDYMLRNRR